MISITQFQQRKKFIMTLDFDKVRFVSFFNIVFHYNASLKHVLKVVYDSVRREVLYSILIEFGVPMKLVRLLKYV
jgi:hypothetical protein